MTMTKQDRICMISLFAVMLVLMGVPALYRISFGQWFAGFAFPGFQ